MSAEQHRSDALVQIAALTVHARRTGDLVAYLCDVEHVLSSLIVLGAAPRAGVAEQPALHRTCTCRGPAAHRYDPRWCP